MDEKKYISIAQRQIIISSLVICISLIFSWLLGGPFTEWRIIQRNYTKELLSSKDSLDRKESLTFSMGIKEIHADGLNRNDRCISCHITLEDTLFRKYEGALKSHPGILLEKHPVDKFGCTICHNGQGLATTSHAAHARGQEEHWNEPMLPEKYMESSCLQCHLTVFDDNSSLYDAEIITRGKQIFLEEGCLGCHKARGVGGLMGPDLTLQGEKTRNEYDFAYVENEATVYNWLKEHFRDPEMVSPGSRMLKFDLSESDLDALVNFVLGLKKPDIDFEYFTVETLNELKGVRPEFRGEQIMDMACVACHGKEGEGKDYKDYEFGVPAILGEDFTRTASGEFILFTLQKGRSHRQMAAWSEEYSDLTKNELVHLVDYIENYHNAKAEEKITATSEQGKKLFERNCTACHSPGGFALNILNEDFLKDASDTYILNILQSGRKNAGMPSWSILSMGEQQSIVKFLRNTQIYTHPYDAVIFAEGDPETGALKYHFLCSRCHGDHGEGQTGPSIIDNDFLKAAPDSFLYRTIAGGRGHTAMFGWSKDVYNQERLEINDIANIISYLRKSASDGQPYIYPGKNPGNKERGKALYSNNCSECHGPDGEGIFAPSLNNQEFLNAATNGFLMATISLGRGGTAMPEWSVALDDRRALGPEERKDLVAWIRAWENYRITFSE